MQTVIVMVIGIGLGMLIGAVLVWLLRKSHTTDVLAEEKTKSAEQLAQAQVEVERHRADCERYRADAEEERSKSANERAIAERHRAEAAEARQEAAEWQSRLAGEQARARAAEEAKATAIKRAAELAADRESLANQFKALSQEMLDRQGKSVDAAADARLKATEQLLAPVQASLKDFQERLRLLDQDRIKMTTDLHNHVLAVRQTGEEIRRETQQLVTALRKPQVRGAWGEMQLRRVAEIAGMLNRCDFREQASQRTVDGLQRPDMTILLADGKEIYVDAKVPLSAFLDAADARDEQQRQLSLNNYAKNVRTHVEQLGSKRYFDLGETSSPEFVVLFLPGEGFLHAALEQIPELYEFASSKHVVIATPSTLIALLRTVAHVWQQSTLAQNADQVLRLGREVYERLSTMGGHLTKLGRSLTASVDAYNRTVGALEHRVLVSARKFNDLEVIDKPLLEPAAIDQAITPLGAAELILDRQEHLDEMHPVEQIEIVETPQEMNFSITSQQPRPGLSNPGFPTS